MKDEREKGNARKTDKKMKSQVPQSKKKCAINLLQHLDKLMLE